MKRPLKTWRDGRLYESPEAAALAGEAVTLFGLLPAPVVEEPEVLGAEYEAWLDALEATASPAAATRAKALRAAGRAKKLAEAA